MQENIAWSAAPLDGPDRRGAVVCGWTLRKPLARGPVCSSWLAERAGSNQPQAVIRILREPFATDPDARAEWLRGSWAANRFEHSRVVKIAEEGADESGAPVVVRRWIRGDDLGQAIACGRVDAGAALRLAEQLLDALEMAHAHGIAHGALTPSNVIVTPRGSVRLVDFATPPGLLARKAGRGGALAAARASVFSPPERRHGAMTEQADVWSVGACLHFALSGRLPAGGPLPPLRVAAPGVDSSVASVVDLALARDPADRYESAYAMLGDIRRVMVGRRPKLESALAPVPSQGPHDLPAAPPSAALPSTPGVDRDSEAPDGPDLRRTDDAAGAGSRGQWRGNVLLVFAISLLVGIASFVMFREKLADVPTSDQVR